MTQRPGYVRWIGKPLSTRGRRDGLPTVYVIPDPADPGPVWGDRLFPVERIDPNALARRDCAIRVNTRDLRYAWPRQTDLCCWWCTEPFDGVPFPLPIQYHRRDGLYTVHGIFCSPSCAKAYSINDMGGNSALRNSLLQQIAYEHFGYTARRRLVPAPRREVLRKFCGEGGLSIEEFRACGTTTEKRVAVNLPFFLSPYQVVENEQFISREVWRKRRLMSFARRNETIDGIPSAQSQGGKNANPEHFRVSSDPVATANGLRTQRLTEFFGSVNKNKHL